MQGCLFELPDAITTKEKKVVFSASSGTFINNMKLPVHRWFRYSAGFSAEWAEGLIRDQAPSCVLDPFAGSGTTLLASQMVGVSAIGFESHPFVARIAQAKMCWNQSAEILIKAKNELLQRAVRNWMKLQITNVPDLLAKCFRPDTLKKLLALRDAYQSCNEQFDHEISELLWLAITAILRSCSFVGTAQWQYVLPSRRKSNPLDPFVALELKVADMLNDLAFMKRRCSEIHARVLLHDARTVPDFNYVPQNSIDLVVTSPPYPNNYDYADATRLEMTFWGEINSWSDLQLAVRQFIIRSSSQHVAAEKLRLDQLLENQSVVSIREELSAVCNKLAEVRQYKGGKKAYHTMVAAYFFDLSQVFQSLRYVCKSGCKLCFVIGDSAPYGIYVPVDVWLGRLAIQAGFKSFSFQKIRDRNVKWKNRKHTVPLQEGILWIEG